MAADPDKPSLSERLTRAFIKAETSERSEAPGPETVEELEEAVARMDDKERLIGLAAAPLAGLVAIIVVSTYGVKSAHPTSAVDSTLALALFALALVALITSWFRKRLFVGITFALYGLSIFNLHHWEFGIPFLLIGSWYLVRAYRFQQKLTSVRAGGDTPKGTGGGRATPPSKRYTPPSGGRTNRPPADS